MIHYYALGGGIGHLTRGRRVLETLGLEATFITASAYASDVRVTGGFPVVQVPPDLSAEWLRSIVRGRLIVDTFPCGIQGELSGLDVPMDLVARRLRWDEYRRAVPHPLPRFDTVWLMEDLEPAHQAVLCSASKRRARLQPASPGGGRAEATPYVKCWLIVHSGPEEEVRELVAYAEELFRVEPRPERVLVATRCAIDLPPGFELIDAYPVTPLFASAEKIISAAGFNIMLETEPYRDKHHPVPFARRFDDQFARAAARKRFATELVTT